MTPLVAALACLAVYRLSLIVTADEITEPPRSWLIGWLYRRAFPTAPPNPMRATGERATWEEFARKDADPPKLVTLLLCPWCCSAWIAAPVAWSAWCFGERSWWFVPALALSASAVAGFLAHYASPDS